MIINSAKYSCAAGHGVNEDSCLCSTEKGLFIVADGLGGHSDGEKASLAAVDYFEENCSGGYTSERITELLEGANTEVLEKGDGGKTTVAAAFLENGNFIYANVGDSRVYYFRDGKIIAQTKDHSVCQASVDMGIIRPEDIRGNEDRSRLLKVLGSDESLNIKKHYPPIRIQSGDAFLICSDGFWDYVYETEMETDLLKSDNSETWLKYMLKRHILRAQNKGDNYTAICGIIYLEEGDAYIPPATEVPMKTPENAPKKKSSPLIPIAACGALLIAAAIALFFLLNGKKGGSESSDMTESGLLSDNTPLTSSETSISESSSVSDSTPPTSSETSITESSSVSDSTPPTSSESSITESSSVSDSTPPTSSETSITESSSVSDNSLPTSSETSITESSSVSDNPLPTSSETSISESSAESGAVSGEIL